MPLVLAFLALVAFLLALPLLAATALTFTVLAGVLRLLDVLSEAPAWLRAMTVVLSLLAGLCLVTAVTSW